MKKLVLIILIVFCGFINIMYVNATSGFLKSSSIQTCNGITYGSHGDGHWHVAVKNEDGRYNASGNPIYTNPCENSSSSNNGQNNTSNNNYVAPSKSSDNTLKSLKVDNESIEINDNMNYTTMSENVIVYALASDNKAVVEYDNDVNLEIGNNLITIVVKAENGNKKEYKLNIIREKELSDNKNIKIKVNEEEINFTLYKSEKIYASYNDEKINISYELEDKNAKVEIIGNENLKVGENEITLKVIAENGDEQDYKIIVEKYSKTEDIIYSIITLVFMVGSFIGIGFLIYYFIKKRK